MVQAGPRESHPKQSSISSQQHYLSPLQVNQNRDQAVLSNSQAIISPLSHVRPVWRPGLRPKEDTRSLRQNRHHHWCKWRPRLRVPLTHRTTSPFEDLPLRALSSQIRCSHERDHLHCPQRSRFRQIPRTRPHFPRLRQIRRANLPQR